MRVEVKSIVQENHDNQHDNGHDSRKNHNCAMAIKSSIAVPSCKVWEAREDEVAGRDTNPGDNDDNDEDDKAFQRNANSVGENESKSQNGDVVNVGDVKNILQGRRRSGLHGEEVALMAGRTDTLCGHLIVFFEYSRRLSLKYALWLALHRCEHRRVPGYRSIHFDRTNPYRRERLLPKTYFRKELFFQGLKLLVDE